MKNRIETSNLCKYLRYKKIFATLFKQLFHESNISKEKKRPLSKRSLFEGHGVKLKPERGYSLSAHRVCQCSYLYDCRFKIL